MHKINKIPSDVVPFFQIADGIADFPKSLYLIGGLPESPQPTVSIVGTRKPTAYGQEVTYRLSYELASRGVVIVSGLALGTDSIAHKAALDAGGTTIAVLPGGADNVYPRSHRALADRIVTSGGALISEYPSGQDIYRANFIARNRIVAAIAHGVLITEAAIKSGTIHTAGFALNYGRPVMAVPGNITNPLSSGTNNLINTGARLVTCAEDILDEIGVQQDHTQVALPMAETKEEEIILKLIASGTRDGETLHMQSGLSAASFSQTMTMLEITQKIRPLGSNKWTT